MTGQMPGRLEGRTAVLTGAAGGLAGAFAAGMAREGATVMGVDIADQSGTEAAVTALGGRYVALTADITSPEDCARVAAAAGDAAILVNNAGIFPMIPFAETTLADWRRIHGLNVEGTFSMTQALLPAMIEAGWGRVVMISSAVAWLGPPGMVAYTASKSALIGMVRALASEIGGTGVTVNAITPGLTRTQTALTTAVNETFPQVVAGQAVPRAEEAEDLVSTLLYICDAGSAFLTGQSINVDGGYAKH